MSKKLFLDWPFILVDLLSSEVVPRVLSHLQTLISNNDIATEELLDSNSDCVFWLRMMEAIRDPYTLERMSEQILHQLATLHPNDIQAYWVLWLLFHRNFKLHTSIRLVDVFVTLLPFIMLGSVGWLC